MGYQNLVYQTTTGTGTGSLTLSAATGWRDFATAFGTGSGNSFTYVIRHQSAAEWEVGTGYMSDATTLVRSAVIASSNSNTAVTFSAGTKDVMHGLAGSTVDNLISQTLLDAKGDLLVASAADTAARLAVGTDGQVLSADSGAASGMKWSDGCYGTGQLHPTGQYVGPLFVYASGAVIPAVNNPGFTPLAIPNDGTYDRIGVEVTTVGGAGSQVRLAIYANSSSNTPGSLIVDAGTVATDSGAGTGFKEITISAALSRGVVWLAARAVTAAPYLRGGSGCAYAITSTTATTVSNLGASAAFTTGFAQWYKTGGSESGAYPSTAIAVDTVYYTAPRILLRKA